MGAIGTSIGKKCDGASFSKTITTAGTPEALSADHIFCTKLDVQVPFGNTGTKLSVSRTVTATLAAEDGIILAKGNGHTFNGVYLDEIYCDVGTDGDKVIVNYETPKSL